MSELADKSKEGSTSIVEKGASVVSDLAKQGAEKTQEVVKSLVPTKEGLMSSIKSAEDMVVGSKDIPTEIKRMSRDALDIPTSVVETPFKAMSAMWNDNATAGLKELLKGVSKFTKANFDYSFGLIRTPLAGIVTAGKVLGKGLAAPIKGTLAVGQTIGDKLKTPVAAATKAV